MNIKEIDAYLKTVPKAQLNEVIVPFKLDERAGVKKVVEKYEKQYKAYEQACNEWTLKCEFDNVFHEKQKILVGIDEVGRGPLAGPVVAAAVILPYETRLIGLKDSKKLTEAKREALYDEIKKVALGIGIGIAEAPVIDEINILQATFKAMREALSQLDTPAQVILVDGDHIIPGVEITQHAVIGGDNKSASIAAASVIAKVTRDRMMVDYAKTYPNYDWESNKGYGSQRHYDGIREKGLTPLHRRSFLKNLI
nr:ribonuclease HII [uncultured Cellulosilyticum sp.]